MYIDPSKSDFFLNSYPRTGSTFLKLGINLFLDKKIFEQIHSTFLAGKSIKDTVQVVVIRKPVEAITSNIYREYGEYLYKNSTDRPEEKFDDFLKDGMKYSFEFQNVYYKTFYQNVLKNNDCLVVFFEDFSVDIKKTLVEICSAINNTDPKCSNLPESAFISKRIFDTMRDSSFSSLTTMTSGNMPREKGPEYDYIKSYVESNTKEIEECLSLYDKLYKAKYMI